MANASEKKAGKTVEKAPVRVAGRNPQRNSQTKAHKDERNAAHRDVHKNERRNVKTGASAGAKKNVNKGTQKGVKRDVQRDIRRDAQLNADKVNTKNTAKKVQGKDKSKNNESEVMALSVVSFVLNTALTILFYVVVVIAIVRASKSVYNFGYEIFGNVSVDAYPGRTVNVVIDEGETTMNVASKLEINKIIKNKYSFYLRTKLSEKDIYPGTYQVNTSMNYEQILDVIANYDTALENLENQAGQNGGTAKSN